MDLPTCGNFTGSQLEVAVMGSRRFEARNLDHDETSIRQDESTFDPRSSGPGRSVHADEKYPFDHPCRSAQTETSASGLFVRALAASRTKRRMSPSARRGAQITRERGAHARSNVRSTRRALGLEKVPEFELRNVQVVERFALYRIEHAVGEPFEGAFGFLRARRPGQSRDRLATRRRSRTRREARGS